MKKLISLIAVLAIIVTTMAACSEPATDESLWSSATYQENHSFGSGDKTIEIEVLAEDKSVVLTVNTDEEILGKALLEHGIIEGEDGPYGIYITRVNGMEANYSVNQSYWAVTKGGEYVATGVDAEEIADGNHYEFTYTIQ